MSSNNETLQQEMAALRQQYHANLSDEVTALLQHSTLPELESLEHSLLSQLRDTAHRLAGSALTFGYEQIGMALRELESTLESTLAGQQRSAERIRKALEQVQSAAALAVNMPEASATRTVPETVPVVADDFAQRRPENLHLYVLERRPFHQ